MTIPDQEICKANRLISEKSPYLLQHAYNPVNWYAWTPEAFKKAQKDDKPIFLSIGYSTCHWCHVMERESFEDPGVAEMLNRDFVAIKVDREERPDIDQIYLRACQVLNGQGGWPLTVIMTGDKVPFYARTYLPKNSRGGLPGLLELLPAIVEMWKNDRSRITKAGQKISEWINETEPKALGEELSQEQIDQAGEEFKRNFDPLFGGFGHAPKFPTPHNLLFLLRYHFHKKDQHCLTMVEKTLRSMYQGGIYDHIGFGFARYSTDNKWLVPHFEKMLYDNALLAMAYLETYQITRNNFYARVAREIFTYILRDMTSPGGGFFSAEDADSEGEEGKFYTWGIAEVRRVLGEEADRFCRVYDITPEGNFEGENIPNLINSQSDESVIQGLQQQRKLLFSYREKRVHPFKDDKILTGWNGLMIAALSMGARILGEKVYLEAAQGAASFLWRNLRRSDGRLLASFREGETGHLAYAADYAYFIWGLMELYQANFQSQYLQWALKLNEELLRYFWDEAEGGLFFYGSDSEELLFRPKEIYDGALPSDNAVAAMNFLRLARLTGNTIWEDKAGEQLHCFASVIKQQPIAHAFWLIAAMLKFFPGRDIVIVGERDQQDTCLIMEALNSKFNPGSQSIFKNAAGDDELEEIIPYLQPMGSADGQASTYICEGFSCHPPVVGAKELRQVLDSGT